MDFLWWLLLVQFNVKPVNTRDVNANVQTLRRIIIAAVSELKI